MLFSPFTDPVFTSLLETEACDPEGDADVSVDQAGDCASLLILRGTKGLAEKKTAGADVTVSFPPLSKLSARARARARPCSRASTADIDALGGGEGYSIFTSFRQ